MTTRSHFNPRHFALDSGNSGGRKALEMNRELHERKLRTMRSTLDLSPPKSLVHPPAALRRRKASLGSPSSTSPSRPRSAASTYAGSPSSTGRKLHSSLSNRSALGSPTGNGSPNTSYNSHNKSHNNNNNSNNNSASQDMSYRQMTSLEILRHHFAATPQDERVFYEFVELLAKQQLAIDVKEIADLAIRDALDQQLLAKYGDVSLSHAHEDGMDDRSYQSRQSYEPEQKPVEETHATRHPEPQTQAQPQPESAHVTKDHPKEAHADAKTKPVEQQPEPVPVRSSQEEQQPKIVEPKDEQSAPAKHQDASEPKTPVHPPETPVAAHSAEGQRRVLDGHEQHQQPVPKQVD